VAVWVVVTVPATIEKFALIAPGEIVTLAGTLSAVRLLERLTDTGVKVTATRYTVQDLLCPAWRSGGQDRANNCADVVAATKLKVEVRVIPFALAVITADWFVDTAETDAEKLALVLPAGTVILAGTETLLLLSVRLTMKPPAGAAPVNCTTQFVDPGEFTLVGEQVKLFSATVPLVPPTTVHVPRTFQLAFAPT
jgi:hypothetical protein